MNATVTEQQQLIGHQQVVIEELNETNVEQQEEIDKLKATVGVLNGSLVQLTSVVEQLLQATTFVPVGETTVGSLEATIVDCADDSDEPCASTVAATTTTAEPLVALEVCYGYPCGDSVVDVWAWGQEMTIVVEVFNSLVDGSTVFDFELRVGFDGEYQLSVSVEFVDGRVEEALVESLTFAALPTLLGVEAERMNGSAALNWFAVTVNATDVTELVHKFWMVDVEDDWK